MEWFSWKSEIRLGCTIITIIWYYSGDTEVTFGQKAATCIAIRTEDLNSNYFQMIWYISEKLKDYYKWQNDLVMKLLITVNNMNQAQKNYAK